MIELNNKIIKKYNKLFDEAAKYYCFDADDIREGYNGCHIIKIYRLGIPIGIIADYLDAIQVIQYVEYNCKYLAPFYHVFYGVLYNKELGINNLFFEEINNSIIQIRMEHKLYKK